MEKARTYQGTAFFGNELRSAFDLERRDVAILWSALHTNRKLARLYSRPCTEPIVFSYWGHFERWRWDHDLATQLTSSLAGRSLMPRVDPASSGSPGSEGWVEYLEPEHASYWLKRIAAARETLSDDPFAFACYVYAEIVISHPFPDGNGRLARSFLQGSLAHTVGLSCPVLPLGPVVYQNSGKLACAFRDLSDTGEWGSFIDAIADITAQALVLV